MDGSTITIVVAVIGVFAAMIGHLWARIHKLESEIREARTYNRALWVYCRKLIDQYYRFRSPGSPDPDPLPDEN